MRKSIDLVKTPEVLDEAGAGPARINTHIHNGDPFFVISASRANLPAEENSKRNELLKNALARAPGASFIQVTGQFREEGQEYPTLEDSFFVLQRSKSNPKKFIGFGEKLMGLFQQEAIIYGDGSQIFLKEGGKEPMVLGDAISFRAEVTDNAEGSTEIKGRKFSVVGKIDSKATAYGARKS